MTQEKPMNEVFLDRIDGEVAVLIIDRKEVRVPRRFLPADAHEGDVLDLTLKADPDATQRAREKTVSFRVDLGAKDDGGDIKL